MRIAVFWPVIEVFDPKRQRFMICHWKDIFGRYFWIDLWRMYKG